MRRIILAMLVAVIGTGSIRAQSIGPSTINASGGYGTASSDEFEWSIGEMTMVSTFTGSSIIVTQGVLQPTGKTASVATTSLPDNLVVFPNPATSVVNIQYTSAAGGTLSYRLMDVAGHAVRLANTNLKPGANSEQVDVVELACGTYMLEVTVNTTGESPQETTYKIQKLK